MAIGNEIENGANWIKTAWWTAGAVVGLAGMLSPPLRKVREFLYEKLIGSFIERRISRIEPRLLAIEKSLKPNSGSSIWDKIDRLESNLAINTQMTRAAFTAPKFLADRSGNFLWVSPAWCGVVWLSEESCRGVGWMQMICEKDREAVLREWRSCIAERRQFLFTFCVRRGQEMEKVTVEMQADPWEQGFFMGSLREAK